ncbi:hypothetical protein FCR2A7T_04280 [Flavobacterium cauense R2A-7]|uniref:Uncharacterized protein n=1 Tax=Flavobacterium cauense R2A-7 TaxID=1341154 RepID=V6SC22_9FLAO|nr:hypothetical protein [Flavobacterium cauense]ESU21965.1 hypothetical protein FCR2A7T_04280 [Flavobacterium cauense R2A-7]TWI13181.1 hypothetical protein IP98_01163 [Flavobacterium cauense R2A-7]
MKSKALILVLIFFKSYIAFPQDKKAILINYDKSIYINKDALISNVYHVYASIKSSDPRFLSDQYQFQIIGTGLDELPLEKIKEKADLNTVKKSLSFTDLKKMKACELHELLSLCKNIYLIKKENDEYFFWRLHYTGTTKNAVITNTN